MRQRKSEDAIEQTLTVNPNVLIVIKSHIPVGYTERVRAKYGKEYHLQSGVLERGKSSL